MESSRSVLQGGAAVLLTTMGADFVADGAETIGHIASKRWGNAAISALATAAPWIPTSFVDDIPGINWLGSKIDDGLDALKAVFKTDEVIEIAETIDNVEEGSFSIIDWAGYPNGPKPEGPFRILEGEEYEKARKAANSVNRAMHRANPSLQGLQIHEIHPIKFGGSPTDLTNKIPLTRPEHAQYTTWWNRLLRNLTSD
ncbi:HNH endonuclease [Candidatus Parcubacteria bacterium]|nr:MAG: HNH endonuclease [Candidatus Parcubacteria bacterium]